MDTPDHGKKQFLVKEDAPATEAMRLSTTGTAHSPTVAKSVQFVAYHCVQKITSSNLPQAYSLVRNRYISILETYKMISKIPLLRIFILAIALCTSCKKNVATQVTEHTIKDSVAAITAFTLINANPQITLTSSSVEMRFSDTVADVSNMVSSFTLSAGATATVNGVAQQSGITKK